MRTGSVVVAAATADGVALAVDSRTTEREEGNPPRYRIETDTAEKLFISGGRFAVATYGMAEIGGETVRGLLERFDAPHETVVSDYARAIGNYFHGVLDATTPVRRGAYVRREALDWPLGFVVVGFDPNGVGRVIEIKVRTLDVRIEPAEVSTENPGVVSRGQSDAIERLLQGVDWPLVDRVGVKLKDEEVRKLEMLAYDLRLPASVPDAVNFAEFLVRTQIHMQDMSAGTYAKPRAAPGCGGLIRSLTVTRAGAEWVSNPGEALLGQPLRAIGERVPEAPAPARRSA